MAAVAREARPPAARHVRGTLLTIGGVVLLSPDAALVHLIGTDTPTMVFWRGIGMVLVATALVLATRGRAAVGDLRATGWAGALLIGCLMASQLAWVGGVHLTNPAHVLVFVATSPLFGVIFSRLILGEPIRPVTVAAMAVALVAVAITVSVGLRGGAGNPVGDLAGLVVAISLGLGFTLIRQLGLENAFPQFAISGLLNALLMAALFPLAPIAPDAIPLMALLVLVILPGAFYLISAGPRLIPAPEVALIMLLEVPLGIVCLWLLADRPATPEALVGGGLLVTTLAAHAVWVSRRPARVGT